MAHAHKPKFSVGPTLFSRFEVALFVPGRARFPAGICRFFALRGSGQALKSSPSGSPACISTRSPASVPTGVPESLKRRPLLGRAPLQAPGAQVVHIATLAPGATLESSHYAALETRRETTAIVFVVARIGTIAG